MHAWRRLVPLVAALLVGGLALAGCGSSDQPSGGKSPSGSVHLGSLDGFTHFTYKVDNVTADVHCPVMNLPPRNGRYVVVRLTVTAHKAKPSARSPVLVGNWSARDAAGHKLPADYSRTMLCLPRSQQFPTTLDSHGRAAGSLVFDVSPKVSRLVDKLDFAKPTRSIVLELRNAKKGVAAQG
ncbi:MAG: hypothetical protein ACRDPH_07580 [Marmoricola sp.]